MKQRNFPISAKRETKSLVPAYAYGFLSAAAFVALPFLPLIKLIVKSGAMRNYSLLTILTSTLKTIGNASDPKAYLLILNTAFPLIFLAAAAISAIKIVAWLAKIRNGHIGAIDMTSSYFAVLAALVGYTVYSLFFNSLIFTFDEVGKEIGSYVSELSVTLYGKYYILYGGISAVGIILSAAGNLCSSLLRPSFGTWFYRLLRFVGSAGLLAIVCLLPVMKVSYSESDAATFRFFAATGSSAYIVDENGISCDYTYISHVCEVFANAFTGNGNDITPTLLLSLFVYLLPSALLAISSSVTIRSLGKLVQPEGDRLCEYIRTDGDEMTSAAYDRFIKPKKLGYTAAVFFLISAAVTAALHFGFAPLAKSLKITSYSTVTLYFAPYLAAALTAFGIILIVYAAVFNGRINAKAKAATVKALEEKSADEVAPATADAQPSDENETTKEETAPAGTATEPIEETSSDTITCETSVQQETPTEETVDDTASQAQTIADENETETPAETETTAEKNENEDADDTDEYARVAAEYTAFIDESNEELRKFYKRLKTLKAAAEDETLGIAEKTCKSAEYERALYRKRSYAYESGLIIKGYKAKLAELDASKE